MSLGRILPLVMLPALLIVGAHITLQFLADWAVFDGRLVGPDGYMRLLRVMELAQGGGWYDPISERSNAPIGETLHWTRPLDLLLLLGGGLGSVVAGFDAALFAWGALIGPLLHLIALVALIWACRPLFERAGLILLGLLFAVQFFITFQFAVGRPDHHGLNILLFIWQMGFALRLCRNDADAATARWAALPAAMALWVSIEGGLGTAMILGAMALAWIVKGGDYLAQIRRFLSYLCLGIAIALLLERPPDGLASFDYDRLSLVHLTIFALLAAMTLILQGLSRRIGNSWQRFGLSAAACAGAVAVIGFWLPDILQGPMAKMAPLVREVWFQNNAEVSPILKFDDLRRTGPKTLTHLGLALVALPAALALILRHRGDDRLAWTVVAIFLVLGLLLALREGRWAGYPQILSLLPCIALLFLLFRHFAGPGLGRVAIRVLTVILLATGPLIGGGLLRQALPVPKLGKPCDLPQMSRFLQQNYGDRPHAIINFIYSGPELLYRTHHLVVATPYHRNTDGITDTIRFFRDNDGAEAIQITKTRDIDLVLICPKDPEASNYRRPDGPASVYDRLVGGQPPNWLRAVPLPAELAENFKLFQVSRSQF